MGLFPLLPRSGSAGISSSYFKLLTMARCCFVGRRPQVPRELAENITCLKGLRDLTMTRFIFLCVSFLTASFVAVEAQVLEEASPTSPAAQPTFSAFKRRRTFNCNQNETMRNIEAQAWADAGAMAEVANEYNGDQWSKVMEYWMGYDHNRRENFWRIVGKCQYLPGLRHSHGKGQKPCPAENGPSRGKERERKNKKKLTLYARPSQKAHTSVTKPRVHLHLLDGWAKRRIADTHTQVNRLESQLGRKRGFALLSYRFL